MSPLTPMLKSPAHVHYVMYIMFLNRITEPHNYTHSHIYFITIVLNQLFGFYNS